MAGSKAVVPSAGKSVQKLVSDLAVKQLRSGALKLAEGTAAKKAAEDVAGKAVEFSTGQLLKTGAGIAGLFVAFVDTYSKAVAAAKLDNVRKNVEVCPHIGQCSGVIDAQTLACDTTATVWCSMDDYWYFHPQFNYRVRASRVIYRSTADGGWKIERPGRPEFAPQDCWACRAAHSD